ncbi:hypothetical protein B296_00052390, partial [Ensete ventricosum]
MCPSSPHPGARCNRNRSVCGTSTTAMALVALPSLTPSRRYGSSFLPPTTMSSSSSKTTGMTAAFPYRSKNLPPAPLRTVVRSSAKIVRCPPLDRHAAKHNRLRFVRKLKTLLLS